MRYLFILLLFCSSVLAQDIGDNSKSNSKDSVKIVLKGTKYWNNASLTTKEDYSNYWKQINIGEIIDVLDGDCKLGKLDVPPKIICIIVTGLSRKDALAYLVPVTDKLSDTIMVKSRKFYFSKSIIDSSKVLWTKSKSYLKIDKEQFESWIKEYTKTEIDNNITSESIK